MKLTAQGIKKDFPRASKSSNYFTAVQPMDFELTSGQMIEVTGRSFWRINTRGYFRLPESSIVRLSSLF